MLSFRSVAIVLLALDCSLHPLSWALVNDKNETPPPPLSSESFTNDDGPLSRRNWLWKAPLGAVGTYAYGRLVYNALSVSGFEYPAAHEDRVSATVARALTTAAAAPSSSKRIASGNNPLRVLEVGIGTEARLIRRGLYDAAIGQLAVDFGVGTAASLSSERQPAVELVGLDFRLPGTKVRSAAEVKLQQLSRQEGVDIDFQLIDGSITEQLPFSDGHFDAIICCLTLCSVEDPESAIGEMRRLLRPSGGTLGFVEHVAVDRNDQSHRFLELQQQLLDPLQQRLADNCHLHRTTEKTIASVMGVPSEAARFIQQERFYVDNMWPVSCQSCGVVQRV